MYVDLLYIEVCLLRVMAITRDFSFEKKSFKAESSSVKVGAPTSFWSALAHIIIKSANFSPESCDELPVVIEQTRTPACSIY